MPTKPLRIWRNRTSIIATTATKFSTTSSGWRTTVILPDGRPCRITHGPNESVFSIAGKSIASVRRSLATVFSIPDEAEAFVGGSVVGPEYRLRAGDEVEFLRGWGRKASLDKRVIIHSPIRGQAA
jgi:hypothetical protein